LASSWVIGSVYLIVGMAIAHKLVAMRSNLKPMLIVLYLLLLFPYTAALASVPVAVLGWSDTWMNYRARMAAGGAPPPDEEDR
jgi:Na+/serine symporter